MGRDMAKILSQKGYDLILVARDEKKLEEVKKQLKTETKIVVMDISKEENCKKIYEENKDIDILINNSGFRPRPPAPPRPPVPPPPPPRPGRPPRPPMGPGPGRPPFNRSMYEQDYDIYEY